MNKFWFVWNTNGRSPRYEHTSQESAIGESKRLAGENPDETFVVLEAVGYARTVRPVEYHEVIAVKPPVDSIPPTDLEPPTDPFDE